MSGYPANLILRFFLLIVAFIEIGQWGWQQTMNSAGIVRFLTAFGLPLLLAAVWAVFDVPEDEPQSGRRIIPIPGRARLVLEFAIWAFAIWAASANGHSTMALTLAFAVLLHSIWSADRLVRLFRH